MVIRDRHSWCLCEMSIRSSVTSIPGRFSLAHLGASSPRHHRALPRELDFTFTGKSRTFTTSPRGASCAAPFHHGALRRRLAEARSAQQHHGARATDRVGNVGNHAVARIRSDRICDLGSMLSYMRPVPHKSRSRSATTWR